MRNIILSFIITFNLNIIKGQYVQNIPFDSTLTSSYYSVNGCNQTIQTKIQLDTSLFNYVTGIQFLVIFDSVNYNGPSSQINTGDTIVLNSTNPLFFNISGGSGMNFWYRIKLLGTPSVANENYPCKIEINQCTCTCLDIVIKASSIDTTRCFVDITNSVRENENNNIIIYPNPASSTLSLSGINGKTNICLYNSIGDLIIEKETNNNIMLDTSQLAKGVYFLYLTNERRIKTINKVIIAK